MRVQDIREYFKEALTNQDFVIDKTGVKTLEMVGASFIADEETIFGDVNREYVKREIEWYESMSLNVNDIPDGPPTIWKLVATPDGVINSNYGWCICSYENGEQYQNTLKELLKNPTSRRAIMIYNRPAMHLDFNWNGMSDFMCTNAVQYLIRDNEVHAVVQMRSNDVVYGFRNDFAWQKHVLDKLTSELNSNSDRNYSAGPIHWSVGSLHIYERHFNLVQKAIEQDEKDKQFKDAWSNIDQIGAG